MSECIEWQGGRNRSGYGSYTVSGKSWLTHRLAWTQMRGPIPDGIFVLHRCDNPPCFNVNHLFLGTQADNMTDKTQKGRASGGPTRLDENPNSKLSCTDVNEIRVAMMHGAGQSELARLFGVVPSVVSGIFNGKRWVSR